jgi:hypothetical protein
MVIYYCNYKTGFKNMVKVIQQKKDKSLTIKISQDDFNKLKFIKENKNSSQSNIISFLINKYHYSIVCNSYKQKKEVKETNKNYVPASAPATAPHDSNNLIKAKQLIQDIIKKKE